jgi:hypothetical protein
VSMHPGNRFPIQAQVPLSYGVYPGGLGTPEHGNDAHDRSARASAENVIILAAEQRGVVARVGAKERTP